MTLMGKIFIVLIFLMSIFFMATAVMVYQTHRNWKELVTNTTPTEKMALGLKPQLEDARNTNRQLRVEIEKMKNTLAHERAARREALAVLEARSAQLNDQLVQKQAEYANMLSQSRKAIETVDTTQNTLKSLKDEVEMLREQVRATREDRDSQFAKVVELTDGLHQSRGDLQRLKSTNTDLVTQVKTFKGIIEKAGLPLTPRAEVPPILDGVVTAVARDKFIEVSIGTDDGLAVGHQLNVTRGGSFLGRAVVRKADSDRSVAELLDDYRKGRVAKGDLVKTHTGAGGMLSLKTP